MRLVVSWKWRAGDAAFENMGNAPVDIALVDNCGIGGTTVGPVMPLGDLSVFGMRGVLPVLIALGASSGMMAVLVFALYIEPPGYWALFLCGGE